MYRGKKGLRGSLGMVRREEVGILGNLKFFYLGGVEGLEVILTIWDFI